MKYVLGAILLIALVVWIVHNIRAIIRLRKAKKGSKKDANQVDGVASSASGKETGEEKPND